MEWCSSEQRQRIYLSRVRCKNSDSNTQNLWGRFAWCCSLPWHRSATQASVILESKKHNLVVLSCIASCKTLSTQCQSWVKSIVAMQYGPCLIPFPKDALHESSPCYVLEETFPGCCRHTNEWELIYKRIAGQERAALHFQYGWRAPFDFGWWFDG